MLWSSICSLALNASINTPNETLQILHYDYRCDVLCIYTHSRRQKQRMQKGKTNGRNESPNTVEPVQIVQLEHHGLELQELAALSKPALPPRQFCQVDIDE